MPALGVPGFSGTRLKEAREARGLSAASVAEVVGVSRQVISQYEHGQTSPTPDRLFLIAARLNLPVRFFLQADREGHERTVFFRSLAAATKTERTKAERRLGWLEDLIAYLATLVEFPGDGFPTDIGQDHDPETPWSRTGIDDAATALRGLWRMDKGPIVNMVALLESHGGVATRGVVETETIDAFSARLSSVDRPAFFFGADKDSAARSRFDAAHELGHHVLHRRVRPRRLMSATERKTVEQEAHRFATSFLLPAEEFARDLRAPTLESMVIAKERWRVSVGAMIQRCVALEILYADEAERLWVARAKRGWARDEPLDSVLPIEEPSLLRDAIELVIREGIKTSDQIVEDLPFDAADVEALAGLHAGRLVHEDTPIRLIGRISGGPVTSGPGRIIDFPNAQPSGPEQPPEQSQTDAQD